jgi:serine protease
MLDKTLFKMQQQNQHFPKLLRKSLSIVVCASSAIICDAATAAAESQSKSPRQADVTDQIIIKYKESKFAEIQEKEPHEMDIEGRELTSRIGEPIRFLRKMSGDSHVLKLNRSLPVDRIKTIAELISQDIDVEYASPDHIVYTTATPNDPQYIYQWSLPKIGLPAVWDITTGSNSVVVAVVDTGIVPHSDLSASRIMPGYDFISDPIRAGDGNGRDSDPRDEGDWDIPGLCYKSSASTWHGTSMAGLIGAATNNSNFVAGINWNVRILPVRVLGRCGGFSSDINDGIRWAAGLSVPQTPINNNPARVINLSFGQIFSCTAADQAAIDAVITAGATVIASAGNDSRSALEAVYGNCNNVINVAATDDNGFKASFSNFGVAVTLAAPGTTIDVLKIQSITSYVPNQEINAFSDGTSEATAIVSGVVSLILSVNPSLTPAQVKSILQTSASPFGSGSTCPTFGCGAGIVNALGAVNLAMSTPGLGNPPTVPSVAQKVLSTIIQFILGN